MLVDRCSTISTYAKQFLCENCVKVKSFPMQKKTDCFKRLMMG